MIPGIVAGQNAVGGAQEPVLNPTNIMRDGASLVGHELLGSLKLVGTNTLPYMNDGVLLDAGNIVNTSYARVVLGGPDHVNGAGAVLQFSSPVALGRIGFSAYSADWYGYFEYVIEARIGATWTEIHRQPAHGATSNTVNYYDFNFDASAASAHWRWKIAGWTSDNNYYVGEVEAFKFA